MTGPRRKPHPDADYDNPFPERAQSDSAPTPVPIAAVGPLVPEPQPMPPNPADDATRHRLAEQLVNYTALTRCGRTVAVARTTRTADLVTCGNCQRVGA